MTYADDLDADDYDPDDDDWWGDDGEPWPEPDPEDHEIAKAYEEHYEHCERVHGGGECGCRPSRLALARDAIMRRAWDLRWSVQKIAREMHTVRIGPIELTVRYRPPARCGACSGKGWFWTKGTVNPAPPPEGCDGAALCGCGSAITRLAESRRTVRQNRTEPPF